MKITIDKFKGIVPKIEPRLLPSEYAQTSNNIRYDSGSLVPFNSFKLETIINESADVASIYKYNYSTTDSRWLYFMNNVMLAKDPIYCYPDNRIIVSGIDVPRIFDLTSIGTDQIVTSSNSYILGLPVPDAPTMSVSDVGSGFFESRTYSIQYDRVWDTDNKIDQGAISMPATTAEDSLFVDLTTNGSVTISNIDDAPDGYGITHITVNRSSTSLQNSSQHFVLTFNIVDAKAGSVSGVTWNPSTLTFSVVDSIITTDLGNLCTNQDYVAPDDTMQGIIPVSSGMLAGYSGNDVCFSEPYRCHAWSLQYRVAIGRPIVGLGCFGDIVVVCTDAQPYIINISDPATAVAFSLKEFAPCTSGTGIVSYRDAVVYPSDAGFMRVDRMGVTNLTLNLADIRDMKNFNLTNVRAAGLGTYYYVLYETDYGQRNMLILNMKDPLQGFGMCDSNILCIYSDFESASLYAVYRTIYNEQRLGIFDLGDYALTYYWKSKIFLNSTDTTNFVAARLHFDTNALVPAETDDSELNMYINNWYYNLGPINGYRTSNTSTSYIAFNLYLDGNLIFTKNVTSTKPFRLPAGIVGKDIEIVLTGAASVYRIDLATSMTELAD